MQTEDLGYTRCTADIGGIRPNSTTSVDGSALDLLCGRVDEHHPLVGITFAPTGRPCAELGLNSWPTRRLVRPDVIGINAYVTSERFLDHRLELHPPHLHGGNGRQVYADVEAARAHGALIDGFGARLRETHARYGLPVAITEVHMGCTREEQLRWLHQAWEAGQDAKHDGVDVRGVTAWAAFGTVDWSSLLTRETGHYEPGLWDIRSDPPRLTALGRLAGALGRGNPVDSEGVPGLLRGPGWWQRDLRLNVPPHGELEALSAQGHSLLIVGENSLARAFARLSHMRGLPYEWRASVDDLGVDALLDLLQSHDIWAVIDTAGGAHARAAGNAAAMRRLVVHVSSLPNGIDQLESDASALHILTGALFGPWSGQHDVLAAGLASLGRGERWYANANEHVLPTYIPDLVQAALDLLIDGESGAWHLTHGESMSWWDFARRAARFGGHDAALIQPIGAIAPAPVGALRTGAWPRLLPSLDDALSRYREDHEPEPSDPPPLRARACVRGPVRRSTANLPI